jgi:hypothetical protein
MADLTELAERYYNAYGHYPNGWNTIKEKEPLFCNICGGENDEHSQDCTCYHGGIPDTW